MLEHKSHKLAPTSLFYTRISYSLLYAFGVILFMLSLGTTGYHFIGDLDWIDAVYNSSMILSGMGPVSELHSDAAKLFASFFAILSGVVFIGLVGLVLSPFFHRVMHSLHIENL